MELRLRSGELEWSGGREGERQVQNCPMEKLISFFVLINEEIAL
jgi:hypothetical protein